MTQKCKKVQIKDRQSKGNLEALREIDVRDEAYVVFVVSAVLLVDGDV